MSFSHVVRFLITMGECFFASLVGCFDKAVIPVGVEMIVMRLCRLCW